jgi:hypothetical protein
VTQIKGYEVQVWHLKKDEVFKYQVPLNSCYPPGGEKPIRTIAGIRGREACADACGEEYSPAVHKVLSIVEWT